MTHTAWHYTVQSKLPLILAAGELRPTAVMTAKGEKPALWFSTHPVWEPTATKLLMQGDGQVYQPTPAELHRQAGLCRFALTPYARRLRPFRDLVRQIRMPIMEMQRLIDAGIAQGVKPVQWWGTVSAIPLIDLTLECWDGKTWQPAGPPGA